MCLSVPHRSCLCNLALHALHLQNHFLSGHFPTTTRRRPSAQGHRGQRPERRAGRADGHAISGRGTHLGPPPSIKILAGGEGGGRELTHPCLTLRACVSVPRKRHRQSRVRGRTKEGRKGREGAAGGPGQPAKRDQMETDSAKSSSPPAHVRGGKSRGNPEHPFFFGFFLVVSLLNVRLPRTAERAHHETRKSDRSFETRGAEPSEAKPAGG